MKIDRCDLNARVMIVAEIGNNHEGDVRRAEEMIQAAAEAGVDAVKFQVIQPHRLVSPFDAPRVQQLARFQLSYDEFRALSEVAAKYGVLFLATPFDTDAVGFLKSLVPAFKVASGDITFFPLLEEIARTGKPVILSTGWATLQEIRRAKNAVERIWARLRIHQDIAILHCVGAYPTPVGNAHLSAIPHLRETFRCPVGYSDHTQGIDAAVAAVAAGARIIEKHFTLDHRLSTFRDHRLSATPLKMAKLVKKIRAVEVMLGCPRKAVYDIEQSSRLSVRRSIVARRDLPCGTLIGEEDIDWVRPGGGIPPGNEHLVLRKRVTRDMVRGEQISPADIEGAGRRR